MTHQAQAPPGAGLQQRPRIASRSQARIQGETTGEASPHPKLCGLDRPPQGTAEQQITVELEPVQLLGHRRRAVDPLGGQGPLPIGAITLALLSQTMAPKQQLALSQNRVAP